MTKAAFSADADACIQVQERDTGGNAALDKRNDSQGRPMPADAHVHGHAA